MEKVNKENMKINMRHRVLAFMIHICTHIYIYSTYILTKYRARNSFMMRSFLFNTQDKRFHDRVTSLVQ